MVSPEKEARPAGREINSLKVNSRKAKKQHALRTNGKQAV